MKKILLVGVGVFSSVASLAQQYPNQTQQRPVQRPIQRPTQQQPRPYYSQPQVRQTAETSPWTLFIAPGYRFSSKDETTVKSSSGTALSTASSNEKSGFLADAEANYKLTESPFSFSGIFEWTSYAFKDASPSDTQLGFFVMPRVETSFDAMTLWAGFGVGLMGTMLGKSADSVGSVNITLSSSSLWNFAWTPRLGLDYAVSPSMLLGFYFSYVSFSGSVDATISGGGLNMTLTEDYTRSWMSGCARIGFRL